MVVGNKAFGFTPDYIMSMPYWLFLTMLIDFNIMSERPEKEEKSDVKKGSGGDLAKFLSGGFS